ncbi:TetR family transcriptional regulator [Aquincola sp. J276]|nr:MULTISPECIES: TetR/AcrR family transcriptional regulator [Aquincola]MCR5865723.1 TetR family transcriptional regulator [Aquincola sp. J276]
MRRPAATPARRTASGAERPPGVRELSARATRDSILKAATKVFAKQGYDGGKVDQISKAAKSYDRMIYYYFGSKEGLFVAVLEECYRRFNDAEAELSIDVAKPVEALTAVIRFMWTYYLKNPDFITLLNTENLHRGKHIGKSLRAREYSSPAVDLIAGILASGAQQGRFRSDTAARDVYLMIAGMSYFYLSNRYTLSAFLGEPLDNADALAHWERFVIDAVLRTVAAAPA